MTDLSTRRSFLRASGLLVGAATIPHLARSADEESEDPLFRISLAQWTLNRELKAGKIDNLDFPKIAHDHGIHAIEYVNQFFKDKAHDTDYLAEMKKRAEDLGVKRLILMCDGEGKIGDADDEKRAQAVENHRKWIDAAKFLGCHSIRVNAFSSGSWDEQVELVADGLSRLTAFGAEQDINVVVENHGGLSSDPDWLVKVMKTVDLEHCGTLPDTGNFRIREGETRDSYDGVKKLMPWAVGLSIKSHAWDDEGNRTPLDHERMLRIALETGFRGYCGIEHGGLEGLEAARSELEKARDTLADSFQA